jgi:hypothetical protein
VGLKLGDSPANFLINQRVVATLQERRLGYHSRAGLEPGISRFSTLRLNRYAARAYRYVCAKASSRSAGRTRQTGACVRVSWAGDARLPLIISCYITMIGAIEFISPSQAQRDGPDRFCPHGLVQGRWHPPYTRKVGGGGGRIYDLDVVCKVASGHHLLYCNDII